MSRPTETVSWGHGVDDGPPVLSPGSRIGGRYEVGEVLGSGGFAVVYRARDRRGGGEVALKVLREDRVSRASLHRLMHEAEIARGLDHPNLVPILDFAATPEAAFIAMEVLDGGSLRERLADGPLAISEVERILAGLLRGLGALHAAGILHRDLKPGNVLFDAAGEARIGDLGLALDTTGEETRMTVDGSLLGTLEYLSPEQALGEEVDARSDLFAGGVLLYEMLTGRLPFEGRSSLGTLLSRFRSRLADPRSLRPEIPDWLAQVALRLLERERRHRYPSAAAVLRDVERRGVGRLSGRRQRRLLAAGAAAAALASAALALGMTTGGRRFSHVTVDAGGVARGFDRAGRVLWRHHNPDSTSSFVRLRTGRPGGMRIAAVLSPPRRGAGAGRQAVSLLEPLSGAVDVAIPLPEPAAAFPGFADHWTRELRAFDVDGDGLDELFVTAIHSPYWPSMTVLVEPALQRARPILVAGGHHRPLGAADLDGDGAAEILFGGINNRIGHLHAIAAVRLLPALGAGTEYPAFSRSAFTPDFPDQARAGEDLLAWYAVVRSLDFDVGQPFELDHARRLILGGSPRLPVLDFDGFSPRAPSPLPASARQAHRRAAWSLLREATRRLQAGEPAASLAPFAAASREAAAAGDALLADWLARREVPARILAGDPAGAEARLAQLLGQTASPSEAAWEAARAFHRTGELERAATWYRSSLSGAAGRQTTRSREEILEGLLLTLVELGRAGEALEAIEQLGPAADLNADRLETYRSFLAWHAGGGAAPTEATEQPSSSDLVRYWGLEFGRRGGAPAGELLARLELERGRTSADFHPLLDGLAAELLAESGHPEEARARAAAALPAARRAAREEPQLRAHLDLLERRVERLGSPRVGQGTEPARR